MDKKEAFKTFLKSKPELVDYIKNKEETMQSLFEIYDVYGEDENVWSRYKGTNPSSKIGDVFKNINVDEIEKHINTAQKALDMLGDLTKKDNISNLVKGPLTERPLNKFFED